MRVKSHDATGINYITFYNEFYYIFIVLYFYRMPKKIYQNITDYDMGHIIAHSVATNFNHFVLRATQIFACNKFDCRDKGQPHTHTYGAMTTAGNREDVAVVQLDCFFDMFSLNLNANLY